MEPIEVTVRNVVYVLLPMPDGTFEVFLNDMRLGKIEPIVKVFGVKWVPADLMSPILAQEIGNALFEKEL